MPRSKKQSSLDPPPPIFNLRRPEQEQPLSVEAKEAVLGMLAKAGEQLRRDLYAGLIRAQTDPHGVRAEALALQKILNRMRVLLTEAMNHG